MAPPPPPGFSFHRWPWWRRWFGTRSERAAAAYLRRAGFRILAQNITQRQAEIDLIAWDNATHELVIVEVRSTSRDDLQRPIQSVDTAKQRKLTQASTAYLQQHRLLGQVNVRFDIVALSWPPNTTEPRIEHLRGAFDAVGRHQMWN
jgi:putative endonuclease